MLMACSGEFTAASASGTSVQARISRVAPSVWMQTTLLLLYRDANLQVYLPAGKRAEVGNSPVESNRAKQAFDHACRLQQCQAKEVFDGVTELNGGIGEGWLTPTLASGGCQPVHVLIESDVHKRRFVQQSPWWRLLYLETPY